MSAIDWTTTQTALDAEIASPADGPDLTLLQDVRTRLTKVGEAYDAMWAASTGVDAAKTAISTAYSTALAAWTSTYTAAHNDADKAARHAESLEVAALTSTSADPYVGTVNRTQYVLAPTSAIVVATDETPIETAAITLIAGASTPELRLVSALTGTAGNRIEVKVENPTSGAIGKCKITARLGSYVEVYDEVTVGVDLDGLSDSLLIASATWLGGSRPDNVAYTNMSSGSGGSFAAVSERIERAKLLASASDQVAALDAYLAALTAAYGTKPRLAAFGGSSGRDPYGTPNRTLGLHYFGRAISVREVEALLTPLIEEATAILNAATY